MKIALIALAGLMFLAGGALLFTDNAGATASAAETSSQASNQSGGLEQALEARGLLGLNRTSGVSAFTPPVGVEVDDTVQRARGSSEVISHSSAWSEELRGDVLHVELTSFPSGQYQVEFWLLPPNSHGCKMFGRIMYDTQGRPTESVFWRNGKGLKITGAADFPKDLYPKEVPAVAVPRALNDSMDDGAQAVINQQVTPFGYVDLHLHVSGAAPVETPAGKFPAVKVESQADIATLLPGWPHFLFHVVSPFIPRTTYYFEAHAPYRLLVKEQEGTPLIGGPEANTELVRYYIEGATADAAALEKMSPQ
ncbi:MAG: hypothetical protein ACREQE_00675 [Candidatus Binataceae bacterium]